MNTIPTARAWPALTLLAAATPPIGADIGQAFNAYALRSQYSF